MTEPAELRLWLWTITDPVTKRRRQTTYRMTEADARASHGDDAVKVESSLEIRKRGSGSSTSDFLRRPRPMADPFIEFQQV